MIGENLPDDGNIIVLLMAFVASSLISAAFAGRRRTAAALTLSALYSIAIGSLLYLGGIASLFATPLLVLNALTIILFSKRKRQLAPSLETALEISPPAREEEERPDTAGTLALIQNYEEIEALSKERTLFMLRRSKQLREALKQQERLNDLQRSFVVMLSHEFRTPLAIMDSSAQKLKSRAATMTPEDIGQRADAIRTSIRRLTDLMEKILASARYEDGNLPLSFHRCDLKSIILNCVDSVADTGSDHRINAALDDLPEILGDKEALSQLFDNLLRNAIKYSPDADRVDVRARASEEAVTVEIQDYGLGIDEDDLSKVFERFFRAKTAEGIEGTGVGLSVVKLITEQHGGTVTVVSRKGQGTTFTICLPTAEAIARSMPQAVGE